MISLNEIRGARILIVDDQEANVTVLEQMLRGAAYTSVTSTRNPQEVCALHREHHYDLILLDLQMPGMDGFQVMEALKEVDPRDYPPVLVITAQPGHKLRALKAGARDFVNKPFDLAEVLTRVNNMLEVRLLHRSEERHSRARLETSQRIANLGDWDYDFATDRLYWSEEVYRILGIARKDFPPDSAIFYRQVHPDDLAFVHREKKAAAQGSRRVDFEHRIIRPGGEVRYVHQITAMVLDDRGQPARESGTVQDITDRRLADDALREKTALLEAQIDSSLDGMLIVDMQGRKIHQNERYVELMKMPRALADGDDHEGARQYFLGMVRHPETILAEVEHLYAHPQEASQDEIELIDGTVLDRHSSPILGKDGRNYGRIWAFRDITANKAAELALRESEERFKFVARAVSDVVWDWDLLTSKLWWNDGFLTTFGFAAGEIEPSVDAWTGRIHPEDRTRVIEGIDHAINGNAEVWSADYRFRRKDGTHAFVQDRGYILRDATSKAIRMVGGMRDLTEQKKMEAQYLRTQRMDSIGTLAGGIAHDLNNVLAPILMSIELLKMDATPDPRRSRILDTIYVSCRRGADLVRQVLSFARGVDGQRVAIRLHHIINELDGIISETFPRNIRIVTDVPNKLWPVTGDPTQLHQVLLNLAVNARDAMPKGGTLTLAASNLMIDEQYAGTSLRSHKAKAGAYVLMQVTDTGDGMAPEIRERIFEPFFTTKELGKGTGIGLATVHTVVKSHGGFVTVESEVGNGTVFKIYLPADPLHRATASVSPFLGTLPRGQDELVLVVDDEFSIRHITQKTLEAFGYRVITAGDGAEAVALYAKQAHQIAVVLTDMMMPVMDGATTIQVLRRINPTVKVIAASGIDSGDNVAKATHAGIQQFLLKPYTAETLLKIIREVLDSPALPAAR